MDSEAWDVRYSGTEPVWSLEPNRFVAAETADLPPGRALDLAAGEGRNALWLAARGWRVTAVDFSRIALTRARELEAGRDAPHAVSWVHADLLEYEAAPGSAELVVLAYLHLRAQDRREVHRRAAAAVAPGGTLLVVAHDASNLTAGVGGPQDRDVLFTTDEVLSDVAAVDGLRTVRAERVHRDVDTPAGRRQAVDLLVRLTRV
jgi:SAM-dependent methyltransferase